MHAYKHPVRPINSNLKNSEYQLKIQLHILIEIKQLEKKEYLTKIDLRKFIIIYSELEKANLVTTKVKSR